MSITTTMNMTQTANMTALDNNNGDQSQNSFEQLCQVALHEKQACVNAAEVNSLGDGSNIVMVLAPPPPPKVTNNDVDHRGHVTQNYLDKIKSHCNNVTLFVKSENGSPSSNNYQEGTIREIRSRSRKDSRDSFSEAFQSTAAQMSLNAEQRSPTFPQQYRKTRDFIAEDLKDEGYWIKRKKNNEAAKRSREKRRNNDAAIEAKVNLLQQMNDKLSAENSDLKKSLAEANEKIQYLQTERALKITNPMPAAFNLEHVGKLTTASATNISAQSAPFFYIPQGASNPNLAGPDQHMEQIGSQNGAQVCGRSQNLNIVQSQTMNQNFNLEQNSNNSAAVLPSASSIMQQSIHRKSLNSVPSGGGTTGNAAALGPHGANSIILPLQSISAALGPAVQQAPNQNSALNQNNNPGAGSVVYLNTGASVVPINATLVQAASVSSASLIPQGVTALPHHSQPVANQNTAVVGTADIQQSASATPTKLLAQAQPVLKPASLVSLSTPIDNIIPLKKRFKDSNSSSPQNCAVNANQTSPVAVGVGTHHHRKGNLTPSSAFILHSDSSGDFTTDTGESNSNPEYWKTQLITIMSEVERLKHQMGSIQQSSTTAVGSPSQHHQTQAMVASPSGAGAGTPNSHQHHHHHQQQPSVAPPPLNLHSHTKPLEMSPIPPPPQAPTTASSALPPPLTHQLMTSAMNMNTSTPHSNGSNAPTPSPAATMTTDVTGSPRIQDS